MSNINEPIVLIGGGGGVFQVARPLKRIRRNITTLQTMFDNGGHSKKLRDECGVLPPGDIRRAILALADDNVADPLRALFSYRFASMGNAMDGVVCGNIMMTALTQYYAGDTMRAIRELCKIFQVQGTVLPISLDQAHLCVKLSDESILKGEDLIDTRPIDDNRTIISAHLTPEAHIYTGAYEAIVQASKIVFCPGDLYTSIIPNTLVNGFREAMRETSAKIIFVLNLMTKKAETHGFTASMFAQTLLTHVGRDRFDVVICNDQDIPTAIQEKYASEKAYPVIVDRAKLDQLTEQVKPANLLDIKSGIVRHSYALASIIAGL